MAVSTSTPVYWGALALALVTSAVTMGSEGTVVVSPSPESGPAAPPETRLDARTLKERFDADAFKGLNEAAFRQTIARIDAVTLLEATQLYLRDRPEYSVNLVKFERIGGKWSANPDLLNIRYRKSPLGVYVKYAQGPHAGREVLYNHATRPGELTVVEPGLLSIVAFHIDLDNPAVGRSTNHRITEIGLEFPISIMNKDLKTLQSRGGSVDLTRGRWSEEGGEKFWEVTVELPGPPAYYAHWARLRFNTRNGIIYEMEVRDALGLPLERFIYRDVKFGKLPANAFDEDNPEYGF